MKEWHRTSTDSQLCQRQTRPDPAPRPVCARRQPEAADWPPRAMMSSVASTPTRTVLRLSSPLHSPVTYPAQPTGAPAAPPVPVRCATPWPEPLTMWPISSPKFPECSLPDPPSSSARTPCLHPRLLAMFRARRCCSHYRGLLAAVEFRLRAEHYIKRASLLRFSLVSSSSASNSPTIQNGLPFTTILLQLTSLINFISLYSTTIHQSDS